MTEANLSAQELEAQLKREELELKKLEVQAKQRELTTSKWLNPVAIGLFAAAIGLITNVVVSIINNQDAQQLERTREQSSLIVEATKTNGDVDAACRNLIFFEGLGLIEDENHVIAGACPGSARGAPSTYGPPDRFAGHDWYPMHVQTIDEKGALLSGVKVEVTLIPYGTTIQIPDDLSDVISHEKFLGTEGVGDRSSCTTDAKGSCSVAMVPTNEIVSILVTKSGYVGNRTNIFFTGASPIVVLKKAD